MLYFITLHINIGRRRQFDDPDPSPLHKHTHRLLSQKRKPPSILPTPASKLGKTSLSLTHSRTSTISPNQQPPKPKTTTVPLVHPPRKPSTPPPPTTSASTIEPYSDDEDILNENVDITIKLAAMEKANSLIRKYKDNQYMKTNPNSPRSWLMGTIKNIIESTDKIMLPHKYNFMNNREVAKYITKLLKI